MFAAETVKLALSATLLLPFISNNENERDASAKSLHSIDVLEAPSPSSSRNPLSAGIFTFSLQRNNENKSLIFFFRSKSLKKITE